MFRGFGIDELTMGDGDRKEKKNGKDKKDKKDKRDRDIDYDLETKEERIARKAAKRVSKVAKDLGYSNDTNPFGDSNLLKPFVWAKKNDKDTEGGTKEVIEVDPEEKRMKTISEIQQVRKRRQERDDELKEMQRLRTEESRLREAAQYGDWKANEDKFHVEQTQTRSKIRISEKREHVIDLVAKNILIVESMDSKEEIHGGFDIALGYVYMCMLCMFDIDTSLINSH